MSLKVGKYTVGFAEGKRGFRVSVYDTSKKKFVPYAKVPKTVWRRVRESGPRAREVADRYLGAEGASKTTKKKKKRSGRSGAGRMLTSSQWHQLLG